MSDEGRVMPSDMTQGVMPQEVTPVVGKGALGTWRALAGPGLWAGISRALSTLKTVLYFHLTKTSSVHTNNYIYGGG
jgi:hypothetical protein